jgi:SAM-dependent methyltransferase
MFQLNIATRLKVWPLPALAAWALSWLLFGTLLGAGVQATYAIAGASAVGVACSLWAQTWWRRLFIAAGFPLSLILSLPNLHQQPGLVDLPAWGWLVPLLFLLLVYPLNAWRDAPLFPTPSDALDELPQHAPLVEGAWVLDAGCGLGHGLQALHRAYPEVVLHGLEWSWPLRLLCALRAPFARVRQGDIWKTPWLHYDMVYLFQRPESMPRAVDKATRDLRPGSWLVSLDFEATQLQPTAQYRAPGGKMVWLYRAPFVPSSGE